MKIRITCNEPRRKKRTCLGEYFKIKVDENFNNHNNNLKEMLFSLKALSLKNKAQGKARSERVILVLVRKDGIECR